MTYCATGYKAYCKPTYVASSNYYCAPVKSSYYCAVPVKTVTVSPIYCAPAKSSYSCFGTTANITVIKCIINALNQYCPPAKPVTPVEPVKPVEPEQPVEPTKPTEPEQPAEPVKPVEPTVPETDEKCEDCGDDGNQNNDYGSKEGDTNPGNVINVVAPEDGAAYVDGTDQKDTITGTSGEDVINGGKGADVIYGGEGNDTLHGDDDGDSLYGEAGKDYLQGGQGNDYLNGGSGADTMLGGDGDDTYFVDNKGDVVKEFDNGAAGHDSVRTVIDYTLTDNVEDLYLQGSGDLSGTGNGLNNSIYGNEGDNHLYGLGGNDCLLGRDGDDYLDGGIGDDVLNGGNGNDTYFFGQGYGYDIIEDNSGDCDVLSFGDGICMEDVILTQENNDLSITFKNGSDSILVGDWFSGEENRIETFKFSDGSSYDVNTYGSSVTLDQIQEQAQSAGI